LTRKSQEEGSCVCTKSRGVFFKKRGFMTKHKSLAPAVDIRKGVLRVGLLEGKTLKIDVRTLRRLTRVE